MVTWNSTEVVINTRKLNFVIRFRVHDPTQWDLKLEMNTSRCFCFVVVIQFKQFSLFELLGLNCDYTIPGLLCTTLIIMLNTSSNYNVVDICLIPFSLEGEFVIVKTFLLLILLKQQTQKWNYVKIVTPYYGECSPPRKMVSSFQNSSRRLNKIIFTVSNVLLLILI